MRDEKGFPNFIKPSFETDPITKKTTSSWESNGWISFRHEQNLQAMKLWIQCDPLIWNPTVRSPDMPSVVFLISKHQKASNI
jgi:hypothetical protein